MFLKEIRISLPIIMFSQGSEKKNFPTEEGKYKVLYTWESRLRNIDSRTHWMHSLF